MLNRHCLRNRLRLLSCSSLKAGTFSFQLINKLDNFPSVTNSSHHLLLQTCFHYQEMEWIDWSSPTKWNYFNSFCFWYNCSSCNLSFCFSSIIQTSRVKTFILCVYHSDVPNWLICIRANLLISWHFERILLAAGLLQSKLKSDNSPLVHTASLAPSQAATYSATVVDVAAIVSLLRWLIF